MRPAHLNTILDQEFIHASHGHHTPVMIWGAPGIGKSQLVADVATRHGVSLVDIRLSQMEPSDLRGIPFRKDDQVEWAVPSLLPDVERHGETGILFLDEINSAPPSVSAAAYQLILDKKLGDYEVPKGWVIFAAGNRQGDHGVTYTMPAPLANRFSHFDFSLNLDDWIQWAYQHGIDETIIAFLRFKPERLFEYDPAQNPVSFPTPRSWEFAHRALHKFTDHPQLLLGSLQACVGQAAAVELKAFIDSMQQLPDIDAILRGEVVSVPKKIDLQYAIASTLITRAIKMQHSDNAQQIFGHILNYGLRFPQKEMGVMLVSDMQRAIGDALFDVPEFATWADSIADVMLYA